MVYSIQPWTNEKCYLLKISEGIHDKEAMKSGSSGFSVMNWV